MDKYLNFCKKCIEGKMEMSKNYYVLDSDEENEKNKKNKNIDVSIVSPTQAAVEQAKSEVRDMMDINRGRKRKIYQIGGKDRRKSKSRRSSFKKQKKINKKKTVTSKGGKKKNPRGKNSKKLDKRRRSNKIVKYRSIWM